MSSYRELIEKRAQLDSEIAEARARERSAVIEEIKWLMAEFEINPVELGKSTRGRRLGPTQPLYWNPKTGATWSGRGRPPKWIVLSNIDAYRIPEPGNEMMNSGEENYMASDLDGAGNRDSKLID
ncbi:H-NS histone family protein [Burkholderia sp. JSH-S8]|nr:H-NS histone family protein [Burkholderia sp. JSH-S8]